VTAPRRRTSAARIAMLRPAPGGPLAPDWSPAAGDHARTPGHRADVDGLRAVAVLAVVAYHAGADWMPGGFAGVDVFFVISGFLITRLLLSEYSLSGRISLIGFWERRARRILPALFAVMAVCAVAAWALMLPVALEEFSFALRGAAVFAANIALADLTDYFARPAELQPLLHLWSLGVEEQFYLIFPLICALMLARAPHGFPSLLALLLALSFGAAVWGVAEAPDNAFFLPHMRAWQLLTGALIAAGVVPRLPHRALATAGLVGAAMLAACFAWLPGGEGFPGFPALAPTAGAALIVLAEGRGPVGALLSLRPVVAVGLISYSLYLWHWPLLVFPRIALGGASGAPVVIPLIAAFALAWLSWRYVEHPFRRPGGVLSSRGVAVAAVCGALAFFGVGLAGKLTHGAPWRFNPEVQALLALRDSYLSGPGRTCGARTTDIARAADDAAALALACRIGAPGAPTAVALWGDSLAMAIQPAVDGAAVALGVGGVALARSACPPFPGLAMRDDRKSAICVAFNDRAPRLAALAGVRAVVIAGSFTARLADDPGRALALVRAVEDLSARGIRAILVPPPPGPGYNVPDALARQALYGVAPRGGAMPAAYRRDTALLRKAVAAMPAGTVLLDLGPIFCADPGAPCAVVDAAGAPLLADDLHPSVAGAERIAPALTAALARALGLPAPPAN
jgi:peptidoglycan/LPS O-acetylase OafA/YrhL